MGSSARGAQRPFRYPFRDHSQRDHSRIKADRLLGINFHIRSLLSFPHDERNQSTTSDSPRSGESIGRPLLNPSGLAMSQTIPSALREGWGARALQDERDRELPRCPRSRGSAVDAQTVGILPLVVVRERSGITNQKEKANASTRN